MSGFRIVRISNVRVVYKCPDFRHFKHFKPKTGSKPVPNRFGTGFGLEHTIRTIETGRSKSGHCEVNGQDIRNPDKKLSEIRTILPPDRNEKRRNPDVRFSDVYCVPQISSKQFFRADTER